MTEIEKCKRDCDVAREILKNFNTPASDDFLVMKWAEAVGMVFDALEKTHLIVPKSKVEEAIKSATLPKNADYEDRVFANGQCCAIRGLFPSMFNHNNDNK